MKPTYPKPVMRCISEAFQACFALMVSASSLVDAKETSAVNKPSELSLQIIVIDRMHAFIIPRFPED
jgi:hypothetical protein